MQISQIIFQADVKNNTIKDKNQNNNTTIKDMKKFEEKKYTSWLAQIDHLNFNFSWGLHFFIVEIIAFSSKITHISCIICNFMQVKKVVSWDLFTQTYRWFKVIEIYDVFII